MNSKAETLKAAALENGDHSQLCTKNIDGRMFLMLASEFVSEHSEDSDTDTDSCSSSDQSEFESLDSDAEITVSLLDENGQEMEEVLFRDNVSRSSLISVPDILKNLPVFPEFISEPVSNISPFSIPTMAATTAVETLTDSIKFLPVTSTSSSALSSTPHSNTFIIKTSTPLSSLDLKNLIYSAGFSCLAPKTQSENTTKTSETVIYPKAFSTDHTYFSSYQSTPACSSSSSTPAVSLVSQKPITATTNFITAPISSVNHINPSLSEKPMLQAHSSSLNTNNSVIHVHVNQASKLAQAMSTPIATANAATTTNQLLQSFPIPPTNVIKPITPVFDTGQHIPKVQIANTNMVGTYLTSPVTSQALASNVQSKSLPTGQIGQLVSLSLASNSNSMQMAPCLLISNTRTNTSSTQSVMKKPIMHSGYMPQNFVSDINQGPGQATVINNVASPVLSITRPTSTTAIAPKNKIAIDQNSLQPTVTFTSSMCKYVAGVNKTDSNSFPSGTSVSTTINASNILSTTTVSTSTSVLAIPQTNSSDGPLLVKIIPKSTPTATESIQTRAPAESINSVAHPTVCTTCLSCISNQGPNLLETNNAKDNLKEAPVSPNMTINDSLPDATIGDSQTNLDESKTAVSVNNSAKDNNVKSIRLLTPSEASTLFSPTTTTTTSVTSLSNSNSFNQDANVGLQKDTSVTTVCQSSDSQQSPVIILKNSSNSSENVNLNSSVNDQELGLKADQEQTSSVKVDDTVQFLKLGNFANPESHIKIEPGIKLEKEEIDSDMTESPPSVLKMQTSLVNDTNTTYNPFFLNDTINNPSSLKIPTSLVNNTKRTDNPSILKIPAGLMNDINMSNHPSFLKVPPSLVNFNNKTDNTSVLKIPTSLVNDTNKTDNPSVLKIPTSLVNDTNKTDNPSVVKVPTSLVNDTNSTQVKPLFNNSSAPIVVNVNQTSPVQVQKPPANNANILKVPTTVINGRHIITLPSSAQVSSSAPVVTLSNPVSSSGQQFVTYTRKPTTGQQVLSLTNQALAGSQVVAQNSQAPTATVFITMPGQTATGTKLVTLPSQVPAGTRLVALPSQSGTGTKLVALPIQTSTGRQLVTIPSQASTGRQLVTIPSQGSTGTRLVALPSQSSTGTKFVALTSQAPTGPPVVTLTSQASTGTRLATLTSQAVTGTQVVTLNSQAPTGAQLVNLRNQSLIGQPRVSLMNPGTSNQQFVPLMNQNLSGAQVIKLPNQSLTPQLLRLSPQGTPGIRLPVQNLTGTQLLKVNSTKSNVKILPLNNAAVLQLSQMAKTTPQLVHKSVSSNNNGQMFTTNTTNKLNSNTTADILKQIQNGEKCAVVVNRKGGLSSQPMIMATMANSGSKVVSMQSLLQTKVLLKNKIVSHGSSVPVSLQKSTDKSTETPTQMEQVEDLPMTLKIDSIYSLKDEENKDVDYWETTSPTSSDNKVNNQAEIGCGTEEEVTSQGSSPVKYEMVAANMKPFQLQQKGVLSYNIQGEKEMTDMQTSTEPQPKRIVYARLNKPKPPVSPIQQRHYKLHDLSNHFPVAQRQRFLDIGRTFRPEMMKSGMKRAHKAESFPIKDRIHFKEACKKKYAFLQPRVMLAQVYIPARMKSIRIKHMPPETVKSLKCQTNCIHRVRVTYPNGKKVTSPPVQNFMLVRIEGKNITPYYSGAVGKPFVPVSISSAAAQNWLLKQGVPGSTNILAVPTTNVKSSFRSILPSGEERKDKSFQYSSQLSPNKDDALSLACGIIQDNTLKRKSSLPQDYDWRGEDEGDCNYYLPYKKKR